MLRLQMLLVFALVACSNTSSDTSESIVSSSATNVVFSGSRHLFNYGNSFLPSPPGNRPSCAGLSDTYCEKIDHYPEDLIDFLLRRYGYDFNTLILDETSDPVHLGLSLATPFSVYVPGQTNVTTPLHALDTDTLRYDTQYTFPYLGPYLYTNPTDQWWLRYLKPLTTKPKQHTISTSYRVLRQTPAAPADTPAEDHQLCPTTSQFVAPKAAVNTRGNWMFVVNQESNSQVTQLVRAVRCTTTKCSGLCQVPAGFTSNCQQQFVQKRLVALSANGQNLYTDTFWFPHCCTCQITSTTSSTNSSG